MTLVSISWLRCILDRFDSSYPSSLFWNGVVGFQRDIPGYSFGLRAQWCEPRFCWQNASEWRLTGSTRFSPWLAKAPSHLPYHCVFSSVFSRPSKQLSKPTKLSRKESPPVRKLKNYIHQFFLYNYFTRWTGKSPIAIEAMNLVRLYKSPEQSLSWRFLPSPITTTFHHFLSLTV